MGWAVVEIAELRALFPPDSASESPAEARPDPGPVGAARRRRLETDRIDDALRAFVLGNGFCLWRLREHYALHIAGASICPVLLTQL